MPEGRSPFARRALAASLAVAQTLFGVPLVATRTAAAQAPAPRVWVAPLGAKAAPGAGMVSEKLDEGTRGELRKSRKLELVQDGRSVSVEAGTPDPRVEQAENLRTAGKGAFRAGDHQGAHKQLKAALELYEDALPSVNRLEAVVETLLYLGAVSQALEYDADAKDFFARALAVAPDADGGEGFPEPARAVLDKVRKREAGKKHGSIIVRTEPEGATVRVDGAERGAAPVTVADLARGDHYVQALHPEAGLAGRKVRVRGGRAEEVTLTLTTAVGPEPIAPVPPEKVTAVAELASKGQLGAEFREGAEGIAAHTRAQYVVVGHVAPNGTGFQLRGYVYGVDEKQVAALEPMRFRADLAAVYVQAAVFARAIEAAVERFPFDKVVVGGVVLVDEPPPARPTPAPEPERPAAVAAAPLPPPPREDEGDPWYTHWWVWTLAGAAVVGGTAYGGYLLLQEEPRSDSFEAKVTW